MHAGAVRAMAAACTYPIKVIELKVSSTAFMRAGHAGAQVFSSSCVAPPSSTPGPCVCVRACVQYCGGGYGVKDIVYLFASSVDAGLLQRQEEVGGGRWGGAPVGRDRDSTSSGGYCVKWHALHGPAWLRSFAACSLPRWAAVSAWALLVCRCANACCCPAFLLPTPRQALLDYYHQALLHELGPERGAGYSREVMQRHYRLALLDYVRFMAGAFLASMGRLSPSRQVHVSCLACMGDHVCFLGPWLWRGWVGRKPEGLNRGPVLRASWHCSRGRRMPWPQGERW